MDDPIQDKIIRKQRETHVAAMVVGVLLAILMLGTVLVAFEHLEIFKAAAPGGDAGRDKTDDP